MTCGQTSRFTIDGSPELEHRLAGLCHRVFDGVLESMPAAQLDALVLGGGYGRGQGGVRRTPTGDKPYNDLEFYVFVRRHVLIDSAIVARLNQVAERLSPEAGLHVEFKVDSLARFRRRPISMFSYDLVAAHRTIYGGDAVFRGCGHHLHPERLPLVEATRLLFNRCTGLLLASKLLRQRALSPADGDFVARNLAKAQLALGDSVLAASGLYDWDCLERQRRLSGTLLGADSVPRLPEIRAHHRAGVDFKLHPDPVAKPVAEFQQELQELSRLAAELWLWLERRRLHTEFASPRDYAVSRLNKCPEAAGWKNYLLNLRTLGPGALVDAASLRYPRNRLFNSLPLLLWNGELQQEPDLLDYLQRQLHTDAGQWPGLVSAYQKIWTHYG